MRAGVFVSREDTETWERHSGAASSPLGGYRRREPEKTLLHQVVRERLEPFLAAARERSAHGRGLPTFVERELRAYLDCGILARGFARVRCPDCGFEKAGGLLLPEVPGEPDAPAGDHSTGVDAAMLPTAGDEPLLQRTRTIASLGPATHPREFRASRCQPRRGSQGM